MLTIPQEGMTIEELKCCRSLVSDANYSPFETLITHFCVSPNITVTVETKNLASSYPNIKNVR